MHLLTSARETKD